MMNIQWTKSCKTGAVVLSLASLLLSACDGGGSSYGSGSATGGGGSGTATGGSGGDGGGQAVLSAAIKFGGDDDDEVLNVKKITEDRFIVYGTSKSSAIDFNQDGAADVFSNGGEDGFIAAYDLNAKYLWGHQIGGTDKERIAGARVLEDGGVILVGDFDSKQINADNNANTFELDKGPDHSDMFIIKYDKDGALKWTQRISTPDPGFDKLDGDNPSFGAQLLSNGSFLIYGKFSGDYIDLNNDNVNEKSGMDYTRRKSYVAIYDSNNGNLIGSAVYSLSGGNVGHVDLLGGRVLSDGILIYGSASYGTNGLDLNNDGQVDLNDADDSFWFFARYKNDGTLLWSNKIASTGYFDKREINDVKISDSGLFVAGEFTGDLKAGDQVIAGSNKKNGFLVKFNSQNGNLAWAKVQQGVEDDSTEKIQLLNDGSVVISGHGDSPQLFYADGGNQFLASKGGDDSFVVKYDSNGAPLWAHRLGSTSDDYVDSLDVLSDGQIVLVGRNSSDTFDIDDDNISDIDASGVFVVVYQADGSLAWLRSINPETKIWEVAIIDQNKIHLHGHASLNAINYDENPGADINSSNYGSDFVLRYDQNGNTIVAELFWPVFNGYYGAINDLFTDYSSVITGENWVRLFSPSGQDLLYQRFGGNYGADLSCSGATSFSSQKTFVLTGDTEDEMKEDVLWPAPQMMDGYILIYKY